MASSTAPSSSTDWIVVVTWSDAVVSMISKGMAWSETVRKSEKSIVLTGLVPEAVVVVLQFAFESLHLHRIEVAIIPRNASSRRVAEKLGLRAEGVALGFLEINGEWEDHVRYAITAEEWAVRRGELLTTFLKRA